MKSYPKSRRFFCSTICLMPFSLNIFFASGDITYRPVFARLLGASLGSGFSMKHRIRLVLSMSAIPKPSTFSTCLSTMVMQAFFCLWNWMRSLMFMSNMLSPWTAKTGLFMS